MSHIQQYFKLMLKAFEDRPKAKALYQWQSKNARRIKIVSYTSHPKLKKLIDKVLGENKYSIIKPNQCFQNALAACFASHEIEYVEGYLTVAGIPLEHAWNRWKGIDFDLTQEILEQKKLPHYEIMTLDSPQVHFWASETGMTGPYRTEYFFKKVDNGAN